MHLRARPILFLIISVPLFAGCAFFAYYTLRLIYVNLTTRTSLSIGSRECTSEPSRFPLFHLRWDISASAAQR